MTGKFAMCPSCHVPLIMTLVWPKSEFYCLECGRHLDWLAPVAAEPTPEVTAHHERLQAEWDEHAGPRLRLVRGWFDDCEQCKSRETTHDAHASEEERVNHEAALAWLRERAHLRQEVN